MHCVTRKGKGHPAAEQDRADRLHVVRPGGDTPSPRTTGPSWTSVFAREVVDIAAERPDVVGITLDRAGVTGDAGPSHNGMWDLSMLQLVPGLRIAATRDAAQLRAQLREAVAVHECPTVVRYPKGNAGPDIAAIDRVGGMDVLARTGTGDTSDVLLVPVGRDGRVCLQVADKLADQGITSTVLDPRWVKPVDPALPDLAASHRLVVTVEDNLRAGGVGSAVAQALRDAEVTVPLQDFGIPPPVPRPWPAPAVAGRDRPSGSARQCQGRGSDGAPVRGDGDAMTTTVTAGVNAGSLDEPASVSPMTTPVRPGPGELTVSAERALLVLEVLASSTAPVRLSDPARSIGYSKATVHRL